MSLFLELQRLRTALLESAGSKASTSAVLLGIEFEGTCQFVGVRRTRRERRQVLSSRKCRRSDQRNSRLRAVMNVISTTNGVRWVHASRRWGDVFVGDEPQSCPLRFVFYGLVASQVWFD